MVYDKLIKGLTVRLRSADLDDAEITYKMRTDPEKTKFIHKNTGTVEDQRNYLMKQRAAPGDYLFIIEDFKGNPIGMKGVYNYDANENTVESGRFIGYGSPVQNVEALKLSFDFAFEELGVSKIRMTALENNAVMLGIQEKFGAQFTHRELVEDLNKYCICSELTRESYIKSKTRIESLIKRFSGR